MAIRLGRTKKSYLLPTWLELIAHGLAVFSIKLFTFCSMLSSLVWRASSDVWLLVWPNTPKVACWVFRVWISCSWLLTRAFKSKTSCTRRESVASFPRGPRVVECPWLMSPSRRRATLFVITQVKKSVSTFRGPIMQMRFYCSTIEFTETENKDKHNHDTACIDCS